MFKQLILIKGTKNVPLLAMQKFQLKSNYPPKGDQPQAIKKLIAGYNQYSAQTLLGVTGSGKTFTMANVIQELQKPTLVLSHNKTLAAQLYQEFLNYFPNNKVCYFVSYYDYYQPESYLPQTDTYIEKDTAINEKIERLRLEAASSLMTRKDVIVVASVSCIYGFGQPKDFEAESFKLKIGQTIERSTLLRLLINNQYERNDTELKPGRFRVRGDTVDIAQASEQNSAIRVELLGDEIENISAVHRISGENLGQLQEILILSIQKYI